MRKIQELYKNSNEFKIRVIDVTSLSLSYQLPNNDTEMSY